MIIRPLMSDEKNEFNKVVTHPLQSWEWGEFREKTGTDVVRLGQFENQTIQNGLQITFHSLPKINYKVGYLPKCTMFNQKMLQALIKIGKENNAVFIKIEPNLTKGKEFFLSNGLVHGRPLFTKYTFQIDLTQEKESLMNNMDQKTRYNVRLAKRKGVKVEEDNSLDAFQKYLDLTFKTTKRQRFYAHNEQYHRLMWQSLFPAKIAHLLKAVYKGETLVAWILFSFNNVLYYPYGASSSRHRNVMASNRIMWEAMLFGKKIGCHTFDLWGSLGPNPDKSDPWYGFHRFKKGYGGKLVKFIGTYDLVLNKPLYKLYNIADSLRWKYLKIKNILPL